MTEPVLSVFARVMKKISNKEYKPEFFFWRFFAGIAFKLGEKNGPNFLKFQSMFILAIPSDRRQETVSMPKYNLK